MIREISLPPYEITLFSDCISSDGIIYLHCGKDEAASVYDKLLKPRPILAAVGGTNWERDFSPWYAERVFNGGDNFSGGADEYIKTLTELIIPETENITGVSVNCRMLAGYSLAGLFAVYCAYKTNMFSHIASVSGSLWYDNFIDYMRSHSINDSVRYAYFSVGEREKRTKNVRMKTVEDNTRDAAELFKYNGRKVVFELNTGGHFNSITERIAKAAVII